MEENEEFDSDFNINDIPISEGFWDYMENYWHNNREFPESTESSLNRKADLIDGKVPASQLPSYVDDILEFDLEENLPNPGEKGKIYLITQDNTQFRWSGSEYIEINSGDDFMTINTNQSVTGRKQFFTVPGNDSSNNSLWVSSDNNTPASMTFYRTGVDLGQIKYSDSGSGFYFVNSNYSSTIPINALEFRKAGSDNSHVLLGGGSHKSLSDFASTTDLVNYHKIDGSGSLSNASDSRINKSWFDYNWAGTGYSGSVINFSGLSGNYPTELFAGYNTPDKIGIRTKNGDNATWNDPRWIWHDKNFNPSNYWQIYDDGTYKGIDTAKPFSFVFGNQAQKVFAGGLLVSNAYADSQYIPTNGIYSKGLIRTADNLETNEIGIGSVANKLRITRQSPEIMGVLSEANGWASIKGDGFIKNNSDNNHLLLGGGGDRALSDFETSWVNSGRDFSDGTLITTNIDYSQSEGAPWLMEIKGNMYFGGIPMDTQVQGYIYGNTIQVQSGYTTSSELTYVTALNLNGFLCFWFPRLAYWQGFSVKVVDSSGGQITTVNRVVSIQNSSDPGGTKRVNIYLQHTAFKEWVTENHALRDGSNATERWIDSSNGLQMNPTIAGKMFDAVGQSNLMNATYGSVAGYINTYGLSNGNPSDNWWYRMKFLHPNSEGFYGELGVQMTDGNSFQYKKVQNGVDSGWIEVWDKLKLSQTNVDYLNYLVNVGAATQADLLNYIPLSQKGQPNGVATLDGSGLVPTSQLPSYVDDVQEFTNLSNFPTTGETGKIYVATDTNLTYRWSGSTYIQIASGAVQSVNGQTGVVNLTKSDIGLANVDNTADSVKEVAYAINSSKLYSTDTSYGYDGVAPYFGFLSYVPANSRWRFEMSPGTPADIEVAYADIAGNALLFGNIAPSGYSLTSHNHTGVYEPVFSKNTAFNKNFGITSGTVAEGNDSRINNGQTAFTWGNHSAAGYASQSWVYSQDYTTPTFVEESIAELTVELTNPDYYIHSDNKFVTIIITDDFPNEKIIWDEFFPGQSINVINTGAGNYDLDLQGTNFDRIAERETIEYYVNIDRKLIKKGTYKTAGFLI